MRILSSSLRSTLALFGAALALVAGCAANHPAPPAPVSGERPRLVVVLVVDGLPQRQVVEYWDQLAPDGLKRFLDRGAWFSDAHYGHAVTETGPGHATILTGAYPHRSGIIANQWRNPGSGELENCVADPSAPYLGSRAARLEGASPKNLMVESLGDVLKRLDARSKVIAISGKDRGAVLPAGKAGTAYVFQFLTGEFATTTYYMKEHPQWVIDFNAKKIADTYFHQEWKPLLAEPAYARSVPDERPWFAKGGKLPKTLGQGVSRDQYELMPRFYADVIASPFGDALLLEFARAAVEGESLGRDAAPDILVVSLSSHDYINHAYGAESRISQDHVLYLDRAVQDFLNDLDVSVGRDNYLAVLTSDHGFMPAPEFSQSLGRDAGRVNPTQLLARLNAGLVKKFGDGRWVLSMSAHGALFNRLLMMQRSITLSDVSEEARRLLLEERAIEAVYTRAELESGSRAGAPGFEAMRNTWHRERSGDLQIELKPYWMYDSGTTGTTHGSHHPYDTHVPILMYGPSWIPPGRIDRHVEIVDIAPTLARILRVPAPAASEGKLLPLEAAVR